MCLRTLPFSALLQNKTYMRKCKLLPSPRALGGSRREDIPETPVAMGVVPKDKWIGQFAALIGFVFVLCIICLNMESRPWPKVLAARAAVGRDRESDVDGSRVEMVGLGLGEREVAFLLPEAQCPEKGAHGPASSQFCAGVPEEVTVMMRLSE